MDLVFKLSFFFFEIMSPNQNSSIQYELSRNTFVVGMGSGRVIINDVNYTYKYSDLGEI